MQAKLHISQPSAKILAFTLYSDASEVDKGGRIFHPLVMFLAQPHLSQIRRRGNFRYLCLFEHIDAMSLGLDDTKPNRDL